MSRSNPYGPGAALKEVSIFVFVVGAVVLGQFLLEDGARFYLLAFGGVMLIAYAVNEVFEGNTRDVLHLHTPTPRRHDRPRLAHTLLGVGWLALNVITGLCLLLWTLF